MDRNSMTLWIWCPARKLLTVAGEFLNENARKCSRTYVPTRNTRLRWRICVWITDLVENRSLSSVPEIL